MEEELLPMDEVVWNTIAHLPFAYIAVIVVVLVMTQAILRLAPLVIVFLALFNQKVHERLIALIQAAKK